MTDRTPSKAGDARDNSGPLHEPSGNTPQGAGAQNVPNEIYQHGPGKRAALRDELLEAHRERSAYLEQRLAWLTPSYLRNSSDPADEIRRRGYAVYDGPAATVQPSAGSAEPQ